MLLIASYVFYAAWDWRFLSLIWFSTILDYVCGLKIYRSDNQARRKTYLIISLIGNLSVLAIFKYFNFFAESLAALLSASIKSEEHIV